MSETTAWRWRLRTTDIVIVAMLVLMVMTASLYRSSRVAPGIYNYVAGGQPVSDLWFDGDLPRMCLAMTERLAIQSAVTSEHPLLQLFTFAPTQAIRRVTGATALDSIRWTVAVMAGLWIATCYLMLRLMRCRAGDAFAFASLAAVSAAGLAWTMVPELHLPGAITLMAPLCLVAARMRGLEISEFVYTLSSALSLSATISNWFAGIAAAFLERPWRQALQISANALLLVSALWAVLSLWFPEQVYFLGADRTFTKFAETPTPQFLATLISFVSHSVVMPAMTIFVEANGSHDLSVQQSLPGSSGWPGMVATVLWLGLLTVGTKEASRPTHRTPFTILLMVVLLGQLVLHAVFGRETFLFSSQFVPFLVALAAFGSLGGRRRAVIAITWVVVLAAGINNWHQVESATSLATQRVNYLAANPLPTEPAEPPQFPWCPARSGRTAAQIFSQ